VEEIIHEIRHHAEVFLVRGVIAEGSEFSGLQAKQGTTLLRIQVRTIRVEPGDRLLRDFVSVDVVLELILAMRHEVRKNERSGFLCAIDTAHGELVWSREERLGLLGKCAL
jgi:hypothetical protein